jgi:hypothetical protein
VLSVLSERAGRHHRAADPAAHRPARMRGSRSARSRTSWRLSPGSARRRQRCSPARVLARSWPSWGKWGDSNPPSRSWPSPACAVPASVPVRLFGARPQARICPRWGVRACAQRPRALRPVLPGHGGAARRATTPPCAR